MCLLIFWSVCEVLWCRFPLCSGSSTRGARILLHRRVQTHTSRPEPSKQSLVEVKPVTALHNGTTNSSSLHRLTRAWATPCGTSLRSHSLHGLAPGGPRCGRAASSSGCGVAVMQRRNRSRTHWSLFTQRVCSPSRQTLSKPVCLLFFPCGPGFVSSGLFVAL